MAKPGGPEGEPPNAALDQDKYDAEENVKIICLGDSAVGKSKLMERFLMEGFKPQQLSTFALTLYKYTATVDGKTVLVDFWDTAGQERFQSMHASYYHKAHACIMVFDVQRKVTYKNLTNWYKELREFRPQIPCIVVANKIDGGSPPLFPHWGEEIQPLLGHEGKPSALQALRPHHLRCPKAA
ncbi:rab-like protein 2A [Notechis scutatus]|uniref:Rab-like protein 2A n=1 Tax=Notechis scutatus TaxID=8663 RepID=A0A6J1W7G4_9SAUR|nr:rab-like protein 2A [Notechis scutatus]